MKQLKNLANIAADDIASYNAEIITHFIISSINM